jgi:hypothetical protein
MSIDPVIAKAIPAAGVFLLAMSCGMVSTWLFHVIKAEVNAKLPESRRFALLGATTFKFIDVLKKHREMYPESRLRAIMHATVLVGAISWVVLAFLTGVFGPTRPGV